MRKLDKSKIGWIIGGILAYGLLNGAIFHFFPEHFSIIAYVAFLFIPLGLIVVVVFMKFSLLFIKNVEEEKTESRLLQQRQKEIVENMIEGLVVHNTNGKILVLNTAAEKFLGVKMSELKRKSVSDLKETSELFEILFKDLREGNVFEFSFKDKEGREFHYQIIKVILNKERGEILKIIRDVTRAKYLDKMKTEYITIMSHKFLTPLTNIKWSADFLMNMDTDDKKKREENVKNIINNEERLVKLTSYLLNITEIEEGLFGYNFEKVDMNAVIEETINNFTGESKQNGVDIIYGKPREGDYFVNGDKERLNVAVSNYLDNAIKYTPKDGRVEITLGKDISTLKVSVHDNGIGVSPESTQSLFSKFFRDKRAMSVHTEGSGIGLFIVKNIIEGHGGKAGYLPDDDKGSIFFFTLPLYKEKE